MALVIRRGMVTKYCVVRYFSVPLGPAIKVQLKMVDVPWSLQGRGTEM